jgi:predicted  nucleic acid-binding Zn-ribbon protein
MQLSSETPMARKQHRCTWCGEHIEKGDTYVRVSGVFDGDLQTSKFHPECDDACTEEARYEGGSFEFMPYDNERPIAAKEKKS